MPQPHPRFFVPVEILTFLRHAEQTLSLKEQGSHSIEILLNTSLWQREHFLFVYKIDNLEQFAQNIIIE